jgi:hypothetical protein
MLEWKQSGSGHGFCLFSGREFVQPARESLGQGLIRDKIRLCFHSEECVHV